MTKTLFFSGGRPSLPELLRLKVPQQVGANYSPFGVILLNDQMGNRVKAIEHNCHWQAEPIVQNILQEWIEGKGLPVTWDSLVLTLRDIDLSVLANQIHASTRVRMGGEETHSVYSTHSERLYALCMYMYVRGQIYCGVHAQTISLSVSVIVIVSEFALYLRSPTG